jgi:hypothetical protein
LLGRIRNCWSGILTRTAQIKEALCKILCHNICRLIQPMYELNLKPK